MGDEQWRWIVGYEGQYEVSSHGRVRSYRFNRAHHTRPAAPRVMRLTERHAGGYLFLVLRGEDGSKRNMFVHLAVLTAFVGPRPKGLQAGHLNGDRLDNRLDNLRWISGRENQQHRKLHGTYLVGERHPRTRYTDAQVEEMRAQHHQGATLKDIAQHYGAAVSTVHRYVRRQARCPEALVGSSLKEV